MSVKLQTSHGELEIKLHWNVAPLACRNFLELSKAVYYDGQFVYHLVPGKYLVTGAPDPARGNFGLSIYGSRGFKSEMSAKLSHNKAGVVGCYVRDLNKLNENGSQFYITFSPQEELDGKLAIFGQVTNTKVLDSFANLKVEKNHIPVQPVKIFGVTVLDDPWAGHPLPAGAEIPEKVLVKGVPPSSGNACQLM